MEISLFFTETSAKSEAVENISIDERIIGILPEVVSSKKLTIFF